MGAKVIGFVIFLYMIGCILGATMTQVQVGTTETNLLGAMFSFGTTSTSQSFGFFQAVTFLPGFFQNLFNILAWNFPFFDGAPYMYIKWVMFAPISGMVFYGIIQLFILIFRYTL